MTGTLDPASTLDTTDSLDTASALDTTGSLDRASAPDPGRAYWRAVLAQGGSTTIPEWTERPVPGIGEHVHPVGRELSDSLRVLADSLGVRPRSVALAAHAKVLAALSGEAVVVTGHVVRRSAGTVTADDAVTGNDGAGTPGALPCRLTTSVSTWRALLLHAHHTQAGLLAHGEVALDALRRELGAPGPSSRVQFDPDGLGGELAADTVLRVEYRDEQAEGPTLRLRYRTDSIDADYAGRIAGYHLAALALIAADLDAEHARQSLLSPAELRHQVDGLAGARRDLGDRRFHQLFEDRVRRHPDAVAAVAEGWRWTYRELNARANRLARALRARGVHHEQVVAVVMERNLDWLAALLAVFKAGGAYLPIEPGFPAERIAAMVSRAECDLVLTEPAAVANLAPALVALPSVRRVLVDDAYAEGHADTDLGVPVRPDQLAYIYFTSGSTGQPKGAMCEQAGMLNHLWAKIEDLGLGEGQAMAQIAPQCFDISLWQLVSALLVGGRTVIVGQDVILDVARFVDTLVEQRVNVAQVVPSYLEVVTSYLERHPRELPDLHCVSTTGEALKKELTQRWFAVQPAIAIANAYGLTETSDDVTHEVLRRPPDRDRVPLGPPVSNVHIYVLDEHLAPVPLGAPGELVFSGVCVGRGYINDPERTKAAFLDDPLRPGERIYRSGDHGRWLPDGTLEFLGRRDTQVKIRGFRIEIGEIDNALLGVPGIRDGAVVVTERADRGKDLVGFYAGPAPLDPALIRSHLAASLPGYMVPPVLHWRERLPLTGNGKIDTKALVALAADLDGQPREHGTPATATERRLAEAFARVLDVPVEQVGRRDDFFDRGSSLSAVKLAIALDRAVTLKEITRHPVLADLAALLDARANQT